MNAFKRFFALILSLCMVLSFVPVSAFAAETGDEGSVTLTGTPTTPAGKSGNTEPFPVSMFTTDMQMSAAGHYRIPVIVTMKDGRLVAAADVRWQPYTTPDDCGNIDTMVSYSEDNGESWTYTFANYFGGDNPYGDVLTVPTFIDPGLGTDGEKLYMIVDLYPGQTSNANCTAGSSSNTGYDSQGRMLLRANASTTDTGYYLEKYDDGSGKTLYKIYDTNGAEQTGYIVDAYFNLYQDGAFVRNLFEYSTSSFMPVFTSHLYLTTSDDGGETWSEPTMINPSVRPGVGETCYLVNPGRGVYTKDGVLVFGAYRYPTQRANLMFSTDGGVTWKTTGFTNSESSESDIVELSDGTLRMFVRHNGNGNYVQYFDWTPVKDADGNVTDYTPSSAVNTTAVAHNNTNVTAISYSKTSDGKQVVLVAAPGDTSGAYSRYNGKIFTFTVDPQTKAMTLVNTVEVNRAGEPYSYSSLTELDDGTVGLLYEKGDSGNITYVEYDPEELTGLEFDGTYDIFVFGADNTEGEVKVKKTAGVTHIHTQPNTSVSGVDGDYVAYDVVLCTDAKDGCSGFDCTSTYTGEATVTIPITDALAAEDLKGFVVSGNDLDYVMDVTVNTINGVKLATFKAPHFSTVGVTAKTPEESASVQKDVTVKVGGTYVDTLKGVNLTGSNAGQASAATATVTWTGTETVVTYPTAQLGSDANYNGDTIDLNDCLYTFTKGDDGMWTISSTDKDGNAVYVFPGNTSKAGYPQRGTEYNRLTIADATEAGCFTIMSNDMEGNGNTAYLYFDRSAKRLDRVADPGSNTTWQANVSMRIYKPVSGDGSGDINGYERVTSLDDIVDGQYLIVGPATDGGFYALYPNTATTNQFCQLAKVTGQTATRSEYETAVVIEGVTEGTTSVAIGDTLYNITVDGEIKEVEVRLKVGETTTIEDNTGYYIPTYTGKGLNESVATVTLSGTTTDVAQDVADTGVTAIQSGKQYAIVCKRSATNGAAGYDPENSVLTNDLNGSSLHMNGPLADDTTEVWTITQDGNGYTVQDAAGKYLTFGNNGENVSVSDTKTVLTLTYNADGGYWRIYNNGYWLSDKYGAANENALAYDQENDNGNDWVIYEVTPAHTDGTTSIEIKGVGEGETSVVVGNTQYNITVTDGLTDVDVNLKVGETTTIEDNTGNHANKVVKADNFDQIAELEVSGSDSSNTSISDAAVSSLESGKQYVIVNANNSDILHNTGNGTYLNVNTDFTASSWTDADVWTLENVVLDANGNYTANVKDKDGNYLSFSSSGSGVGGTAATVEFEKGSNFTNSWRIECNSAYMNPQGGLAKTYGGNGSQTGDNGNHWYLYEVTTTTGSTTTVTITGVAVGETSVVVGDTRYNITVEPKEVDVNLEVGETTTLTDDTGNYQNKVDRTDLDESIATVVVIGTTESGSRYLSSDAATAIESGKTYVLYNKVAAKLMNNEWADASVGGGGSDGLALSSAKNNFQDNDCWTITAVTGGYYVQDKDGKYLTIARGKAEVSDDPVVISLDFDGTDWTIGENGEYLNKYGDGATVAAGWSDINDVNSQWELYEVIDEPDDSRTTITITGVDVGDTSVIVGNTKYNIHVAGPDPVTVDVNLAVGQSKDFTIDGVEYDSDDVTVDDSDVATVTIKGSGTEYTLGNAVTGRDALVSGKKYVMVCNNAQKFLTNVTASGNKLAFGAGVNEAITEPAVWTITVADAANGTYYIQDANNQYLGIGSQTVYVGAENAVTLDYASGWWKIHQGNQYMNDARGNSEFASGWGDDSSNSTWYQWAIYEVIEETNTVVTITGVKEGETTATVGHVTYNITVEDLDPVTVDVVLKVGETKPFYIEGVAYTDADVDPAPNTTIADMTVFGHTPDDRLTLTDEIKSGREYLIVVNNRDAGNNATHNTLSYSAHVSNTNYLTLYNNYTQANTYWVIEKAPGDANKFYVKTPFGSYLAIESAKAYTTDIPTALDLVYDAAGYWTIAGNNQYLNQYTGVNADYAAGHHTADESSRWEIYERTENVHTQVVFTGMDIGTTTAKVGHVTYNITVAADTRDVEIFVGETWKDVQDGVNATGSNAGQDSSNIADVTWQATNTYAVVARVMDTSGGEDGDVNLADAELTFTKANGKYTILSGTNAYMNIIGYPFHVDTTDSPATNTAITLTFDDDGAVRLMNDAGHYLQVYNGNGNLAWTYKTTVTGTISSDDFEFYIYAPAADAADSSAEVPGYYRITDESQIVSGQKYLIAFVKNGTYYVAYNNGDNGTSNFENMARLNTTVTGSTTEVTVVGKNPGNTKVQVGDVLYNITVKPYEKNIAIEIGSSASYTPAGDVTQEAIDAFNAANGTYVTVALEKGKLVFTGKAEGTVNDYLLGGTLYDIKVTRDVVDGDESKYVGGQSGTQGEGQVITGLIVSNNTVYDLNMAADVTGVITWESSDESVFTIDQNGTVTSGSNAGEAYVNVYRDGSLYQTIPVIVIETPKTEGNNRKVDVYNTEVTNCTAYYTYNKEDIAIFPEGYQFYAIHSKTETDLITFYATPNQGYALSFVNGVNGTWFHTVTNPDGTGYLTDSGTHSDTHKMHEGQNNGGYYSLHDQMIAYVVNNSGSYAADLATVHKMLDQAVLLEVDGGFFYSRGVGTGDLYDSTRFVAEKLPEVKKSVNGILGVSGLQADWVIYQPGMYAEVGEIVYFTIQIEQEAPTTFKKSGGNIVTDAYGQVAALEYTAGASLVDNMKDAYFYTKELDLDDDIDGDGISYEGVLSPDEQKTAQDVTDALNRGWTQEELDAGKRVHEYYVVYPIKPSDLNSNITNTVELAYTYSSTYSNGSRDLSDNAEASLLVLGQSLGDVLVDFGVPVTISGISEDKLPIKDLDLAKVNELTNNALDGCVFGSVNIVKTGDTYSLTYTPDTVMTSYDVIYIMGYKTDDEGKEVLVDGKNVPVMINYVRIRPASTVYYEESFAEFGTANPEKDGVAPTVGWTGHNSPVTGTQEYQHTGCNDDHDHNNFGYDGKYAAETGKSNGTEVASSKSGDTATFTFIGTGFDLYANCDPASSVVAVMVYRLTNNSDGTVSEKLTKYYQVATKTKVGVTPATYDQAVDADGCAIVSVTDLAHGTYKVIVRHTKRTDGSDTAVFYLDGFRIYNTTENSDQYYPAEEQRVTFTELRDEVLYAAGVTADSSQTYQNGSNIVSETANGATVAFLRNEDGNIAANVTDWLNNGPKNEIWMMEDDNLAFTLYAGDATTQAGAVAYAQIGLKAPTGYAKVTIYLYNGKTLAASGQYEITSATDMFYDLPTPANGMLNGMSVTIVVEEGLLSVTKLKTNVYEGGVATNVLMPMDDYQVASALNLIYGVTDDGDGDNTTTNPGDGTTTDPSNPDDGENTDPSDPDDGTTTDPSNPDDGETTDPSDPTGDDLEDSYKDSYNNTVTRIFGENRFETAFKVADELKAVLGVEKFENIIVACGSNFADALSGTYLASVKNAPILLSYNEEYNELVLDYIAENLAEDGTVYILGGNSAVPYTMDLALIAEGVAYRRLAGANRFETNLLILAEAGVEKEEILVCTGSNFADSLSASATGKPILLVYNESGELTLAQKLYLALLDDCTFTVIGGEKAVCPELEKAVAEYGVTKRLAGADRFETSVEIAKTYFKNPEAVVLAYAANYPDGLCGGALAYAIEAPLVLTMTDYEADADLYVFEIKAEGGLVLGGSGLIADDSVVDIFDLEKPQEIIVK